MCVYIITYIGLFRVRSLRGLAFWVVDEFGDLKIRHDNFGLRSFLGVAVLV